jgi:hypothetical protein
MYVTFFNFTTFIGEPLRLIFLCSMTVWLDAVTQGRSAKNDIVGPFGWFENCVVGVVISVQRKEETKQINF